MRLLATMVSLATMVTESAAQLAEKWVLGDGPVSDPAEDTGNSPVEAALFHADGR